MIETFFSTVHLVTFECVQIRKASENNYVKLIFAIEGFTKHLAKKRITVQ